VNNIDANKRIDIVVNGTPYAVASDEVSFDQVGGSVNRCVNRSGGGLLVLACFDR